MEEHYQIRTATTGRHTTQEGYYANIYLIQVADPNKVMMTVRPTNKNIVRIVRTWRRVWYGKTENCSGPRAMKEAMGILEQLEGEAKQKVISN